MDTKFQIDPAYFLKAAEELAAADPILGKVIDPGQPLSYRIQPVENYFKTLIQKIVYQQLSTKAAGTILRRMEDMLEGRYEPTHLLSFEQEDFRQVGISRQKYGYITDLSRHFADEPEFYTHLDQYSDEEVLKKLTEVKGIGNWTAQMFLMFTLGRPDIFAPDDVGIQNAVVKLYGLEKKPGKKVLVKMSEPWRPHRTLACRYLWHFLDNPPV